MDEPKLEIFGFDLLACHGWDGNEDCLMGHGWIGRWYGQEHLKTSHFNISRLKGGERSYPHAEIDRQPALSPAINDRLDYQM